MTGRVEVGQIVAMSVNNNLPVIGIDEVGRGPLAGPLAVGVFSCDKKILKKEFLGIKESKQLSKKEREDWYTKIQSQLKRGRVKVSVSFVSARTIDERGLSKALILAVGRSLSKLRVDIENKIILDGSLYAPKKFINQKTIIKGDEKEPLIALASIVAKVERDRVMEGFAVKFPQYGFEVNKGYGTKHHIQMIKEYGISPIHRKSFLKSLLK